MKRRGDSIDNVEQTREEYAMRRIDFPTEPYLEQRALWPKTGRHILACFDEKTVIVYQAYRREIGLPAAQNGRFGPPWSRTRMSWIKPNFLWMMYRCGWAQKQDQEVVLALRLRREGFEKILELAEYSSFQPEVYRDKQTWESAVKHSEVRLQWDPDHDPHGAAQERRAIQLGLRGSVLEQFADEWIVEITDLSDWVKQQHRHVVSHDLKSLHIPRERPYIPSTRAVAARLGLQLAD